MNSTAYNIHLMKVSMDMREQILDSMTRQEVPDKRTLQMRIESARDSALKTDFPNTSEPAKERLAIYEKQYVDTYGLLSFVKLFGWFYNG